MTYNKVLKLMCYRC